MKIPNLLAIKNWFMQRLANNLQTTTEGYALDARQGKILKDELSQLKGNFVKYKDLIIELNQTRYIGSLSSLGLKSSNTILSIQNARGAQSICQIIGFTVEGDTLYITLSGTVQVGNAIARIVYM